MSETTAFTVAIHHSVASLDPAYDWGTTNTPDVIASYLVGNVVGRVFVDFNGNFVYDAGETPLPGATVSLAGAPSPVQATDSSGQFRFLGVQPGPYVASLAVPAGYVSALAEERTVNVGIGVNTVVDFPLLATGVIQGAVFEDYNGNGLQDGGEPGVAGATVTRSGGGLPDDVATTAADGGYTITTTAAGSYTVTLTTPSGYNSTSIPQRPVELVEGGSAQANFIVQQQGVIEGVVFVDRDGDELLGPGESGL
ncbi:MAG: carboxypeptidase regulatory-like domain-containing protein, partial [Caldilinea sp.]|nr:carboxypeptidase regulatory-like domain-containing protein [Caldilinea sp.]